MAEPAPQAPASTVQVTIVAARLHEAQTLVLQLPAGSTVAQAVAAARARGFKGLETAEELHKDAHGMGIFGKRVAAEQVLVQGDRIELYRPLTVDPKLARQARVEKKRRERAVKGG
jgi:uncharacterized protein